MRKPRIGCVIKVEQNSYLDSLRADVEITAIVTVADDGVQLHETFNSYPPGDLRNVPVAMSDSFKMRKVFQYRFQEEMFWHPWGNLIAWYFRNAGSTYNAMQFLTLQVFHTTGKIYLAHTSNSACCACRWDGSCR